MLNGSASILISLEKNLGTEAIRSTAVVCCKLWVILSKARAQAPRYVFHGATLLLARISKHGHLKNKGRPLTGISERMADAFVEDASSFQALHPGVPRLLSLGMPLFRSTLDQGLPDSQNLSKHETKTLRFTYNYRSSMHYLGPTY